MERWKRILLMLLLCFCFAQTAAFSGSSPVMAKAAVKKALKIKKENGKYYCYNQKGEKVKKKWKTITKGTTEYRYYFDKTGAAIAGKKTDGILVPNVCTIKGKTYGFDDQGHMIKGLYMIGSQFYLFNTRNGVYMSSETDKLRAAAGKGQNADTLIKLLEKYAGKPVNREDFPDSCYGDGKDSILYYSGFMVQLFTDSKGITTVVSLIAIPQEDLPEPDTGDEPDTEISNKEEQTGETSETGKSKKPEKPKKPNKPAKKQGLVQVGSGYYYYGKDGETLKNAWQEIGGYSYYFTKSGKAQTYSASIDGKRYIFDQKGRLQKGTGSRIITVGVRKYYVDASGCEITGWHIIGGKLYYADSTGLIYQDMVYGNIKFTDSGAAEDSVASRLKMKTMSIVASITNSRMSRSQKLQACWNYIVSDRFKYGSRYPNLSQSGWQRETALHMLTYHWGNCYSFACAFAALAREIGYSPYVICGRVSGSRDGAADGLTRHAWVKIDGLYYDPEAQHAGWYKGVYGLSGYYVTHQIQRTVVF